MTNNLSLQIADSLARLKHPNGGFLDGLTLHSPHFQSGPTKIVGPVYTVKFVPKADIIAPKLSGHYVNWPTPPNI
jgi:regulator of RNase E activity RraA